MNRWRRTVVAVGGTEATVVTAYHSDLGWYVSTAQRGGFAGGVLAMTQADGFDPCVLTDLHMQGVQTTAEALAEALSAA